MNPTYNFQEDAYRRWFNNPDRGVDEKVLINVELFVQHFDKYTDRGARSAARAAARRILDEEINLGDETEREDQDMTTVDDTQTQPRKRARPGPDAGTKQGSLTQVITRFGQDEEWTVPPKWRLISDAEYAKLTRAQAEQDPRAVAVAYVRSQLRSKKGIKEHAAKVISLCQRSIGIVPTVGRAALATISGLFFAMTLILLGLGAALESSSSEEEEGDPVDGIGRLCPSERSLDTWMTLGRLQQQDELKGKLQKAKYAFLASDKGNKKGISRLAKIISYFDEEKGEVASFTLDIDAAGSTTEEGTHATVSSLEPLGFGQGGEFVLAGFSSDSGGAGTLEPAVASFMERGIADESTLIANCSLHALNLLLSVPCPKHYGDGGKDESNALQLLYQAHYL